MLLAVKQVATPSVTGELGDTKRLSSRTLSHLSGGVLI